MLPRSAAHRGDAVRRRRGGRRPRRWPSGGRRAADPSDQPGGTSGVLDSRRARRAAEARGRGAERAAGAAGRGRRRPRALAQASRRSPTRRRWSTTPRASWPATRRSWRGTPRRSTGTAAALTPLTLLLSGGDPGDVLSAMGFLDVVDEHAAAGHRRGRDACGRPRWTQQQRADAALEQAKDAAARGGRHGGRPGGGGGRGHRRARRGARRRRQAAGAAAEGTGRRQPADGGQLEGLRRPADRGRRRAAAGGAAATRRRGLPAGLVPVAAAGGGAQRGAAQLPRQPTSLLVLPAETLRGGDGGDGRARPALRARAPPARTPGTAARWCSRSTAPPASRCRRPGGALRRHDAGRRRRRAARRPRLPRQRRNRAWGTSASRWTRRRCSPPTRGPGAVVVRTPAGRPGAGHRPAEPRAQRAPVAAPGPTGGALRMECGNTVYPPSYDGARQWGGYPNGLIPPSAMCPLGVAGHQLRCDAAAAYRAMSAAFAAAFGSPICITDSYRTYAGQVGSTGRSRPWPPCRARATTAGGWRSTCAAASSVRHRRSTPG